MKRNPYSGPRLAAELARLRTERGLSKRQVSRETGIHPRMLRNYETGYIGISLAALTALTALYCVDLAPLQAIGMAEKREARATKRAPIEDGAREALLLLEHAMDAQHITRSELARRAGMTASVITKVFARVGLIKLQTLARLFKACGYSIAVTAERDR